MIREAKISDAAAIAAIIVETWQNAYTDIVDQSYVATLDVQRFVQIMRNNIQQKKEIIYIYEEHEIIKGFISGKIIDTIDHQCETVGLYIVPRYQRMGIGRILFQKMKQYFTERKCRKMILWTLKGAKNNAFYIKHGGTITDEKVLKLGDREYAGVGFTFNLSPATR